MGQASRKDKDKQPPVESPTGTPVPPAPEVPQATPAAPHEAWRKPAGLSRKGWAVLAGAVVLIQFPLIHYALFRGQADISATIPYAQSFNDPAVVARDFFSTGAYWRTTGGELLGPAPKNNPLWLKAALPDDVAVEFDVRPEYPEGDIRVELYGNGRDAASGYVLVQGGWNNSLSVIARRDINAPALDALQRRAARVAEKGGGQGADLVATGVFQKDTAMRVEARVGAPIQAGRTYHWRIERRGNVLKWAIDGVPVAELDDPFPFKGPGHDRLGLSGWESQLFFDNLRIGSPDTLPATLVAKPEPTLPPGPSEDDFNRDTLGDAWNVTNPAGAKLEDGALVVQGLGNRPVWLKKPLPQNATIEFDAWGDSADGDMKVEAWGDGRSFYAGDPRLQYTATGYVFIFGGWRNTQSIIARQHEHTNDRAVRDGAVVTPGQRYHFKITRRDGLLSWEVDGKPFLSLQDASPLQGPGNQYFGFSGWQSRVHFDNLKIQPL